ncbi:MAG: hypothetical protein SFW62_07715 [Alphaproteobacteria bacterium]|nr:hypothetical protein [Alphaproteobacteria bacterium]
MRLFKYLHENLFSQPYRLLPLAVFAFVALSFLYHPQSSFRTLALADPDDYMRLNQVINWLQGQSWHDLSQPRMSPGAGTIVHWSRLVDLPIAFFMLPFIKLFGMANAALLASFIVPLILLGLLLALVPALAEPLVGRDRANLAALFVLFAPSLLFNFTPGRVDHHAYQILIAGFGLLALERMMRDEKGWRFAVAAAVAFACGMWIGAEVLPGLILFLACLMGAAGWRGGFVLRNAALFGTTLPLATAALLPLALRTSEFSSRALSWFSPAYLIFAALAGGALVCSWFLGRQTNKKPLRLALILAFSFLAAMLFFQWVPAAWHGPFADISQFNTSVALDNISEAQPLMRGFAISPHNPSSWLAALGIFVRFLMLPLAAFAAVLYAARKAKPRDRMLWIIHGVFLVAAILLTFFWQVRIARFMQLFALAPLTWLLLAWWKTIGKNLKARSRFWAEIGAFLALGAFPVVILPALFNTTPLYPNVVLFPAARSAPLCPLTQAADFIAGRQGWRGRTYTILSGMNEGPELLFRTPHNVIGGNFDVPANRDVFEFFNARDEAKPKAILRKWHVDLVLACRSVPPFFAGLKEPRLGETAFLRPGPDGKLGLVSSPEKPAFIEKLVNGKAPLWLKPVEIPGAKDYLLFEVRL